MEQGYPPDVLLPSMSTGAIFLHVLLFFVSLSAVVALFRTSRRSARKLDMWWWAGVIVAAPVGAIVVVVLLNRFAQEAAAPFLIGYVLFTWTVSGVGMTMTHVRITRQQQSSPIFWCIGSLFLLGFIIVFCLPGVPTAREAARRAQCLSRLRNIGISIANAVGQNGSFPPSVSGAPPVSWRVTALPFVDAPDLFERYDQSQTWEHATNILVAQQRLSIYHCPSRVHRMQNNNKDGFGRYYTDFVMVTGRGTLAPGTGRVTLEDIKDGAERTIVVVEASGLNVVWTEPRDFDVSRQPVGINLKGIGEADSPGLMSSYHRHGAHAVFADGRVRFVHERIDPEILRALTTIDAGERFSE